MMQGRFLARLFVSTFVALGASTPHESLHAQPGAVEPTALVRTGRSPTPPTVVRATGGEPTGALPNLTLDEAWQALRSDDLKGRERALIRLTKTESIPWIESYVRAYERRPPQAESIRQALSALRAAQARNPRQPALERWNALLEPSTTTTSKKQNEANRRAVEVLTLSQAVTALDDTRGTNLIVRLFRTAPDVWNGVAMHFASQANEASTPGWLQLVSSRDAYVRSWAKTALAARRVKTAGDAVQVTSPTTLAEVIRVFGEQKRMDAMRIVVSFLGDSRRLVRTAAWQAVAEFQTNAIWALREAYSSTVGQEPNLQWGWASLRERIVAHSLQAESAAVAQGLAAAERALTSKSWGTLDRELSSVLDKLSETRDQQRAARLASALGAAYARNEHWQQTATWLQRAKWLAPDEASAHEALLQTALGEVSLRQGLVDAHPFERATALDPNDERPRARLDDLSALAAAATKQWVLLAGVALLAAGAIYMFLSRRAQRQALPEEVLEPTVGDERRSEAA